MQDRRSFLARLGASVGATALGATGLSQLAAACTSAGSSANDTDSSARAGAAPRTPATGRAIGVQLYTLRNEMQKDVEGTLARVAGIGYREVEFAGYYDKSPAEIRAMLNRTGLTAPSTHMPIEMLEANAAGAFDTAKEIGHEFVVVPWLAEARRKTIDDYKRLAESLNRLASAAKEKGLRVGYHNHDFEFVPIGGQVPFDTLLAETDPSLVAIELDLYWATKAGHDPLQLFERHRGRFPLVHVKDSAGAPDHRMVDVGKGTIDFARIFTAGGAALQHRFVEHDNPGDAFASITASYEHLAKLQA